MLIYVDKKQEARRVVSVTIFELNDLGFDFESERRFFLNLTTFALTYELYK